MTLRISAINALAMSAKRKVERVSNCTTGCRTKDHETYGQCLSSNKPGISGVNVTRGVNVGKKWETELKEYRAAKSQGIQPRSTQLKDIRSAVSRSNQLDSAVKDI